MNGTSMRLSVQDLSSGAACSLDHHLLFVNPVSSHLLQDHFVKCDLICYVGNSLHVSFPLTEELQNRIGMCE